MNRYHKSIFDHKEQKHYLSGRNGFLPICRTKMVVI